MPWAIKQDMYMYLYFALNQLLAPDWDLCQGTMHVELDLSLEGKLVLEKMRHVLLLSLLY